MTARFAVSHRRGSKFKRRGLRSYHALYLRISDEVRDRCRQNPHSSLVRVGAEG